MQIKMATALKRIGLVKPIEKKERERDILSEDLEDGDVLSVNYANSNLHRKS